jgi:hypothetical protein
MASGGDLISFGTKSAGRHFRWMKNEWNEKLRCPTCGKTGMAGLSQGDLDDLPSVQSVPDGFRVVTTRFGPNFNCGNCDVKVDP